MDSTGTRPRRRPRAGSSRQSAPTVRRGVGVQLIDVVGGRVVIQISVEGAVEEKISPFRLDQHKAGHVVKVAVLKDGKPCHRSNGTGPSARNACVNDTSGPMGGKPASSAEDPYLLLNLGARKMVDERPPQPAGTVQGLEARYGSRRLEEPPDWGSGHQFEISDSFVDVHRLIKIEKTCNVGPYIRDRIETDPDVTVLFAKNVRCAERLEGDPEIDVVLPPVVRPLQVKDLDDI